MKETVNIFWFRRDLRLNDNAGLHHSKKGGKPVLPIFIFDKAILDKLEDAADKRVAFIYAALEELQQELKAFHTTLRVFYGFPETVFQQLMSTFTIESVFTNNDYEPYAKERDEKVKGILSDKGIPL